MFLFSEKSDGCALCWGWALLEAATLLLLCVPMQWSTGASSVPPWHSLSHHFSSFSHPFSQLVCVPCQCDFPFLWMLNMLKHVRTRASKKCWYRKHIHWARGPYVLRFSSLLSFFLGVSHLSPVLSHVCVLLSMNWCNYHFSHCRQPTTVGRYI